MTANFVDTPHRRSLIAGVWRDMLTEALVRFGADVAAAVARFLPELHAEDPREEEPLRAEAAAWVARAAELAGQPVLPLPAQAGPGELVEAAIRSVAALLPPGEADPDDVAAVFEPAE
jgi:hypothetical protein